MEEASIDLQIAMLKAEIRLKAIANIQLMAPDEAAAFNLGMSLIYEFYRRECQIIGGSFSEPHVSD